jgi:carbonic anhydrase
MLKLIRGIIEFRQKIRPGYRESFKHLAVGQWPDTLFIACSDSRVVPNTFASSDPGDLFVIRNVGNLIAPYATAPDASEAAAIEFSIRNLPIRDVIVCGHSHCGAMCTVSGMPIGESSAALRGWLGHAESSLARLDSEGPLDDSLPRHDQLSQLNVLEQIEHLKTYPAVMERLQEGKLQLHGWWFDIGRADVHAYDPNEKRFRLIDTSYAESLMKRFARHLRATRVEKPGQQRPEGPVVGL